MAVGGLSNVTPVIEAIAVSRRSPPLKDGSGSIASNVGIHSGKGKEM
jgi:hypothetical protein